MARPTKKTTAKASPSRTVAKASKPTPKAPAAAAKAKKTVAARAKPPAKRQAPRAVAASVTKTVAKKPAAKKPAAKPKLVAKPTPVAKPKPAAAPTPAPAQAAPAPKAAAPAPKPPPPPKPKKKVVISEKEAASIREELTAHRAQLERELEDLDIGSLHVSQSELSGEVSFDEEYADAGTFTFERERDLSLSNNIRDLMDKVDSAMRRLDDRTYGNCERCGNPIDKARLKALPYSVLCITCKQQEERIR